MTPRGSRACGGGSSARGLLGLIVSATLVVCAPEARAQETLVVEVEAGQTVRDLSDLYLGSPDLWRDVLALNGLGAASDVEPGMELRVPDLPIAEARQTLEESLAVIQEATALGGSVFAKELLGRATTERDEALRHGKEGRWRECLAGAREARDLAAAARDLTRTRREGSGEAILSSRRGQVQGRRAEALVWTERPVDAVLVENERLRTLSGSFAEVLFSDQSQIRLGENAQAVIQSMQIDRLNDRRRTTVSLVEGDAFALLGGSGARDFDVKVEAVEARIDSKNFWVRRDGAEAKFANYDDRPVKVSQGDAEVMLGWNQGTVVSSDDGPAEPKDLLPPPERAGPADDSTHYRETVLLRWEPVEGAAEYAVEVDRDSRFGSPVISASGLTVPVFAASGLGRGAYSWRVRAVDDAGFPGAPSGAGRFTVETEGRPPFLLVTVPAADGPTGKRSLILRGETDPSATLTIDGVPVSVDENGRFAKQRTLRGGANTARFEVTSPAGLTTTLERIVEYLPGWFAPIAYDPGVARLDEKHFVTRADGLTVSGKTTPDAAVEILDAGDRVVAATRSSATGRFRVTVPVPPGSNELRTRVTTSAGFSTEERIAITRDPTPPALELPWSVPGRTRAAEVRIEGRAEAGARVEVNGVSATSSGVHFSAQVPLAVGRNAIGVVATDAAGNRTERSIEVYRDVGPPSVEEPVWLADDGGRVRGLRIVAADPAGLRRKGAYRMRAGDRVYDGALRLEPDGRTYLGHLPGPDVDAADAHLEFVEVEDQLGNRQRYEF